MPAREHESDHFGARDKSDKSNDYRIKSQNAEREPPDFWIIIPIFADYRNGKHREVSELQRRLGQVFTVSALEIL
jgi:hypothetical protein